MRIERPELAATLLEFSLANGVVIGAPGVGKSHALREMLRTLHASGEAAVPVVVSGLLDGQEAELSAIYGYREGDFPGFLRRYGNGRARRIVVFDGFDAARDPALRARVLYLIGRCVRELPDWTVLVSVREYDARHSADLLRLFADDGTARPFRAENLPCRGFHVPVLTRQEVADAIESDPALSGHISPPESLLEILRVPFNLRLLEAIARSKGDLGRVSGFSFQVQLLQEYWTLRVMGGPEHLIDEECLAGLARAMIAARSLSVARLGRPTQCGDDSVRRLHAEGVLAETGAGGRRIAFGHNILFDYAVQALLLDGTPEAFARLIEEDETRTLMLRPSFAFYFSQLWAMDRPAFWANYRALRSHPNPSVRFAGKLVPASVIADAALDATDLSPLLGGTQSDQTPVAVRLVLQARGALGVMRDDVWLTFLGALSSQIDGAFVNELAHRTREILGRTSADDVAARGVVNLVGRNALGWCSAPERAAAPGTLAFAGAWLLPLITETFTAAPDESHEALSRIVTSVGKPEMSVALVYRLCETVKPLIASDPALVADLYERVFGYEEKSTEATQMVTGIVPMTSNRAQDYQMCRYSLGEDYPAFLSEAPDKAVSAGIRALSGSIAEEDGDEGGVVTLAGTEFRIRRDSTSSDYEHADSDHGKIGRALFQWLGSASRTSEEIETALREFAGAARHESLYGALLRAAAACPASYVGPLLPLCTSAGILGSLRIANSLETFLAVALPLMTEAQVEKLRAAILAIIASDSGATKSRMERLLGILTVPMPAAQPPEDFGAQASGEPDNDAASVPVIASPGEGVAGLGSGSTAKPVEAEVIKAFNVKYLNELPPAAEVDDLLDQAKSLRATLEDPGLPARDRHERETDLVSYGRQLVSRETALSPHSLAFAREIILGASWGPEDRLGPRRSQMSWSSSPATEAARALPALFTHDPTQDVEDAMRRIMSEGSDARLYLVASSSAPLANLFPALFWDLLAAAFARGPKPLRDIATHRARPHLDTAPASEFVRWAVRLITEENGDWSGMLAAMVTYLAFVKRDSWAVGQLGEVLKNTADRPGVVDVFARACLGFVYASHIDDPNSLGSSESAREWLLEAVASVSAAAGGILQPGALSEEAANWLKQAWGVVDEIAARAYFRTTRNPQFNKDGTGPRDEDQQRRMFLFVIPLLRAVSTFNMGGTQPYIVPRTAHYIAQLLAECVRFAPDDALSIARDAVIGGAAAGYTSDPLAVKEAVKLVEILLADHRNVLSTPSGAGRIQEFLDTFVDAGSEEAIQLIWRLDEIFR